MKLSILPPSIKKALFAVISLLLLLISLPAASPLALTTAGIWGWQSNTESGFDLPILLYHSLLRDTSKSGAYTITPSQFEADLLYLCENGYQTILPSQLVAYVEKGVPLPEKPVMITFDDGYYNNYFYGFPLLEQYGMQAVISIVGSFSEQSAKLDERNPNFSYLVWADIQAMEKSGRIEFANHTYDMHRINGARSGSAKGKGETQEVYARHFTADIGLLQEKFFAVLGHESMVFAYPFGSISQESKTLLPSLGFNVTLTSTQGINQIRRGDPSCLLLLKRNNRPAHMSTAAFFKGLQ